MVDDARAGGVVRDLVQDDLHHADDVMVVRDWRCAGSGRQGGAGQDDDVVDDRSQDDLVDDGLIRRVAGGSAARAGGQAPRASGFNRFSDLPRARGWSSAGT